MTLSAENVRAPDVLALLAEVLGSREVVDAAAPTDSITLADLGLQSREALRLRHLIGQRLGRRVALIDLTGERTVADLLRVVVEAETVHEVLTNPTRSQPVGALTEVQAAYWTGRDEDMDLGGVATYWYNEYESSPDDVDRFCRALERSWTRLVAHHEALRIEITRDGRQRVRRDLNWNLDLVDLRYAEDAEQRAQSVRAARSHQVLTVTDGPLFYIGVVLLPDGRVRVMVGLDALVVDLTSWRLLMRQWGEVFDDPHAALPTPGVRFVEHAAGLLPLEEDRDWWASRAAKLPDAPQLVGQQAVAGGHRFRRHRRQLDSAMWDRAQRVAAAHGITPTAAVLSCYALAVNRFGSGGARTIALTLAGRPDGADDCVGQFAQTGLLDYPEPDDHMPFAEFARLVGRRLFEVLDHASISSIAVRRLAGHDPAAAGYPIVFTSGIGLGGQREDSWLGDRVYGVSQTPQVLLDHLAWEEDGDLVLTMDAVVGAFGDGVVDGLLAMTVTLLRTLADEDAWSAAGLGWDPAGMLPSPRTPSPFESGSLLADPARVHSDDPAYAVHFDGRAITHADLHRRAKAIGAQLRAGGAGPGDLVIVALPKGFAQIAAVLGVGAAGAAYVPVDPAWPQDRLASVLRRCGSRWSVVADNAEPGVLTELDTAVWLDQDAVLARTGQVATDHARRAPDDLAYAIFTSGSTGEPKGVAVTHDQARCTIDDIVTRYAISPDDRVLALSALTFDLSVFDVFGMLGAGGAMVLPAESELRDPAAWARLISDHQVTIWNTAPALLEMLVEYAEHDPRAAAQLASLRIVMLSGDWIPVTLPDRLRALAPDVEFHSLGGATEAAIWSITFPVDRVDPGWASIPYGRSLPGQSFHVLCDHRPARVGETGELFIGGAGVATGYVGDPEQTAERFVMHPALGERLYRTGDVGRWRPDGHIEFLGRIDRQVKIQGFRIELGEVEAALARCAAVRQAVAASVPGPDGRPRLVAWVATPDDPIEGARRLRAEVQSSLPGYMVPSRLLVLPKLPVTANGKVDYQRLPAPFAAAQGTPAGSVAHCLPGGSTATTSADHSVTATASGDRAGLRADSVLPASRDRDTHAQLQQVVAEVLGDDAMRQPMIDSGSTSLDAVRLANAIEDALGWRPAVRALLGKRPLGDVLAESAADPESVRELDSALAPEEARSDTAVAAARTAHSVDAEVESETGTHATSDDASRGRAARTAPAMLDSRVALGPMPDGPVTLRVPLPVPDPAALADVAGWLQRLSKWVDVEGRDLATRWIVDGAEVAVEAHMGIGRSGASAMALASPPAVAWPPEAAARGEVPRATVPDEVPGAPARGGGPDLAVPGEFRNVALPSEPTPGVAVQPAARPGASTDPRSDVPFRRSPTDNEPAGQQPFALTEMQLSYLLGRADDWLGAPVAPHYYTEVDMVDVTADQLQRAIDELVAVHPMLRARATADARQRVLALDDPRARVVVRRLDTEGAVRRRIRDDASHRVIDPLNEPWLHLAMTPLDERTSRVHLDLDLLFCDAASAVVLVDALYAAVRGGTIDVPRAQFYDYVADIQAAKGGRRHRAAMQHFVHRAVTLPPPPALPLVLPAANTRFVRREQRFDAQWWSGVRTRFTELSVTPTAVLLTALGHTIGAVTDGADHAVVVTVFDRPLAHTGVIGDYTSTVLAALPGNGSFVEAARVVQEQLWDDLEHAVGAHGVHGNHVLRELAGSGRQVRFPVSFSSGIGSSRGADGVGRDAGRLLQRWGAEQYSISQTPNVALDVQAFEDGDDLVLRWDAVDAAFPAGFLDAMFADFITRVDLAVETDCASPIAARAVKVDDAVDDEGQPATPVRRRHDAADVRALIRDSVAAELGCSTSDVDPAARFFDVGVTSLTVVPLQRRLSAAGYEVTVLDFFAHPSVNQLADALAGSAQPASSPARLRGARRRRVERERRTG
ncbi:MAG: amino acid adenylation domain-containing protein [Cumulibacter sp.]